jgi:hypothetical protein
MTTLICTQCRNARWVCENHPIAPWGDVEGGCSCGAAGMPCPKCNASDGLEPPEMPPGFAEDDGTRH